LPLLVPPANIFLATPGKSTIGPSLKKILPTPMLTNEFNFQCNYFTLVERHLGRRTTGLEKPVNMNWLPNWQW